MHQEVCVRCGRDSSLFDGMAARCPVRLILVTHLPLPSIAEPADILYSSVRFTFALAEYSRTWDPQDCGIHPKGPKQHRWVKVTS